MLINDSTMNLNESDLDNILKRCRDSPSTWLLAYGIYVFLISSTIMNFVACFNALIVTIECAIRFYRNPHFDDDENLEDVFESDFHYFCIFVSQRLALILTYVFGAVVYHSMMTDARISSILFARWWIEAIIDVHCFGALGDAFISMFISFGGYRSKLNELTKFLLFIKIYQFYFFRYPEFHSESELNSLLVCVFRRFCIASHYSRLSDQPILTFIVKMSELNKDLHRFMV